MHTRGFEGCPAFDEADVPEMEEAFGVMREALAIHPYVAQVRDMFCLYICFTFIYDLSVWGAGQMYMLPCICCLVYACAVMREARAIHVYVPQARYVVYLYYTPK
jgi:hypothetical protein